MAGHKRWLQLRSRRSRPVAELAIEDGGGAHLYVVVGSAPVTIAIELEEDQVAHLEHVLAAWRAGREFDRTPAGRRRAGSVQV